ncbi:MAG: Asp-tRNA(Asn)/Glu-tRNA(Gln) amidotransferase subunit GatA, partial [Crocinitomicaceae bacterium]
MLRTYAEVKQAISSGDTVMSILEGYLSAIEETKDLNAFLEVFENSARLQAKLVDEKITNRTAGR